MHLICSKKMTSTGVLPDSFVYNALANGCCKEGEIEKALSLLHEMIQKGIACTITFNTLIDGFCKWGKLAEAMELFKEMNNNNIAPNHITFTILIDHYCKLGMMNEAEELLADMQGRSLNPTNVTYTSLMLGYSKTGDTFKIFSLFENLVKQGIDPDDVICCILVDTHCKEGNLEKAFKLWDELVDKGLLNGLVNDSVIESFCGNGGITGVLEFLEKMGEQGYKPCLALCSALVRGLHKVGYSGKLDTVVETMLKFRWVPESTSATDLASKYNSMKSDCVNDLPKPAALEVACQV